MATASDTNTCLMAILSGSALVLSLHHAYKFDKGNCLLPKKKDWFRVLLTWMLLGSEAFLFIWAAGWCYVKYSLGWVYIEDVGIISYPAELYGQKYRDLNIPMTIFFTVACSLQTSLNAEEGLYWFHLMRAVRQPKSARSWLSSTFFYTWIVITIISTTLQCCIGWIYKGKLDLIHQMSLVMTVDGIVEIIVMGCAATVIWKFPAFLDTVKASGAGPEVRSRLHFFHEANKVRTFFRFVYAAGMIVLGADGLSADQVISNNPIASDILSQAVFGSFFFVLVTSVFLYLPRDWSPEGNQQNNIMVAGHAARNHSHVQLASGVALMSLLKEGGQWVDEDIRDRTLNNDLPYNLANPKMYGSEEPLTKQDAEWEMKRDSGLDIPSVLSNFISPIAVPMNDKIMPTEIRIRVQQEIHRDNGHDHV